MENNQNVVFRFSKINTRIKLIVLWISLIILYNYTNIFNSFLDLIRFSPLAKIINRNIYLKTQNLLYQLILEDINGENMSRTKILAVNVLDFLSNPKLTYFLTEIIVVLTPVLVIIANIFIKKNTINLINIIVGFIYLIIGILILFYNNNIFIGYIVICIAETLILSLIIFKSIQWIKIKDE